MFCDVGQSGGLENKEFLRKIFEVLRRSGMILW